MAQPELEQLRQRVTVSYHLQPLASDETAAYVNHRLQRAAVASPLQFPRDVTDLIHAHSGGVPRKINIISDAILLFGYGEERKVIDAELTGEVIEELVSTGVIAGSQTSPAAPATAPMQIPRPAPVHDNGLAAREAMIAERERQLAEQQRLLFEGYRLLRAQNDRGPIGIAPAAPAPAAAQATASGAHLQPDQMRTRPASVPVDRPTPPAVERPAAAARVSSYAAYRTDAAYRPDAARARREPVGEPEGFWIRLRRGLFGVKPLLEE
jgi:hypothetical protein